MSTLTGKLAEMLDFPCSFPIKIMGKSDPKLETSIIQTIQNIIPGDYHCSSRPSSKGTYQSVTVTVQLQDQQQLEQLYTQLNENPLVRMIL